MDWLVSVSLGIVVLIAAMAVIVLALGLLVLIVDQFDRWFNDAGLAVLLMGTVGIGLLVYMTWVAHEAVLPWLRGML